MSTPLKAPHAHVLIHAEAGASSLAGYRPCLTACILRHSDALPDGSLGQRSSQSQITLCVSLAWRSLRRQLTPRWDGGAAC